MRSKALEAPVARRHLRLVLALLSSRSWSQCVHSETFPGLLAVAFHPEVATAKIGMLKAARLRRALGEALDLARQEPEENQALVACLRDVAYHEHMLVQDLWSLADQAAWDRKDRRLRELLWVVFSGPGNTKVHLEDVFNATRDECRRNPNKRVSRRGRARARTGRSAGARSVASLGLLLPPAGRRPARRWRAYHAARHTTSLENQLPSLKLTPEDWAAAPVVSPARVEEGMFVPGNHKPQIDLAALGGGQAPTARAAGGAWRASGHAANCRSVAASAFLAATAADGFQSAGAAWQGPPPNLAGAELLQSRVRRLALPSGAPRLCLGPRRPCLHGHAHGARVRQPRLCLLERPGVALGGVGNARRARRGRPGAAFSPRRAPRRARSSWLARRSTCSRRFWACPWKCGPLRGPRGSSASPGRWPARRDRCSSTP
jgi:hypothetical protein